MAISVSPALDAASTLAATAPQPGPARPGSVAAARKSAEDFTAFFFTQSLETVYSGISADTMFGGGTGENMYRSMMIQEYGKIAASNSGTGLTDSVQRAILRMQEKR